LLNYFCSEQTSLAMANALSAAYSAWHRLIRPPGSQLEAPIHDADLLALADALIPVPLTPEERRQYMPQTDP